MTPLGPKPNIVVQDAIFNVLQIIEGGDRCLMYDQPIGDGGLSWEAISGRSGWVPASASRDRRSSY
jgi:hypothetical protein